MKPLRAWLLDPKALPLEQGSHNEDCWLQQSDPECSVTSCLLPLNRILFLFILPELYCHLQDEGGVEMEGGRELSERILLT